MSAVDVVQRQLADLAGTDAVWVMTRMDGQWVPLVGADAGDAVKTHQQIAERATMDAIAPAGHLVSIGGYLCLPMTAGGLVVGPDVELNLAFEGVRPVSAAPQKASKVEAKASKGPEKGEKPEKK